jgi:hypothetical protein
MVKTLNKLKNQVTSKPISEKRNENIPNLKGNKINFFNKKKHL